MTCIEKLRELHPDWDDEKVRYYVEHRCPVSEYILPRPIGCGAYGWEDSDDEDCEKCWNRKVFDDESMNRHGAKFYLTGEDLRRLRKIEERLGWTNEEAVAEGLRLLEIKAGLYVWEGLKSI